MHTHRWIRAGHDAVVKGVRISCGMIYVDTPHGVSADNRDPWCIDPELPILLLEDEKTVIPPVVNYSTASPRGRAAFLSWLTSGRRDCDSRDDFIRLFLRGIENRLVVDYLRQPELVAMDLVALRDEVLGLVRASGRRGWLREYATRLWEWMDVLTVLGADDATLVRLIGRSPPSEALPLALRVLLGRMAKNGHYLRAGLAHQWLRLDPRTEDWSDGAPDGCDKDAYQEAFGEAFGAAFPDGMPLPQVPKSIDLPYEVRGSERSPDRRWVVKAGPDVAASDATYLRLALVASAAIRSIRGGEIPAERVEPALITPKTPKAKGAAKSATTRLGDTSNDMLPTVERRASALKTTAAPVPRQASPALMAKMGVSRELAAIVGSTPIPRGQITKNLWDYIKINGLQDPVNKRLIRTDEKLRRVMGGRASVSMFEMTKIVGGHLRSIEDNAFELDKDRLEQLRADTHAVDAVLQTIFTGDDDGIGDNRRVDDEPQGARIEHGAAPLVLGLDRPHTAFLMETLSRDRWSRSELGEVAAKHGLMLDGALERINEAVVEAHETILVEGDQDLDVVAEAKSLLML